MHPHDEALLSSQLALWIEQGVVEPCESQWNSALIAVSQERLLAEMVLPGPETPQRTVQETVGIPRIYRYQSGQAPWQRPLQCVQYEQWIHGRAIGRLLQTILRIHHTQPGDLRILGASFRLGKLTCVLCKIC